MVSPPCFSPSLQAPATRARTTTPRRQLVRITRGILPPGRTLCVPQKFDAPRIRAISATDHLYTCSSVAHPAGFAPVLFRGVTENLISGCVALSWRDGAHCAARSTLAPVPPARRARRADGGRDRGGGLDGPQRAPTGQLAARARDARGHD